MPHKFFKERKNEKIGGGFFVFRRYGSSGRIRMPRSGFPFEHPTEQAAIAEATRLAEANPGKMFCVVQAVSNVVVPAEDDCRVTEYTDAKAA